MGLIETIVRYAILSGVLALVVVWVYRAVKRGGEIKGNVDKAYKCEEEKQMLQSKLENVLGLLSDCESVNKKLVKIAEHHRRKCEDYQNQYTLQKFSRDEMILKLKNLNEVLENQNTIIKACNGCKCEMGTVVENLECILAMEPESRNDKAFRNSVEQIKSILEV